MPVWLDRGPLGSRLFHNRARSRRGPAAVPDEAPHRIELGLLNNMSDSAFEQTERQIIKLLHAGGVDDAVRLKLYALPGVPRDDWGRRHLSRLHYHGADELWNSNLDALIMTGAEPRDARIETGTLLA